MIKFHRPDFLVAPLTLDAPSPKRNLLQKIFHKKKDDLSPAERRAIQIYADRSSRTKLFGGLITIKHKEPDLQSLTTFTVERLRELAGRMRELDAKQEENDQANEAKRIADMQSIESDGEEATGPLDAASNAEKLWSQLSALEESEEEIQEVRTSDEEQSVADTQQSSRKTRVKINTPVEILAQEARKQMQTKALTESSIFTRTEQEASIRIAVSEVDSENSMYGNGWRDILDKQNLERNSVANEIVNIFSAADRKGIDLSKALDSDEIIYLTRAMGLAKAPETLHVADDGKIARDAKLKTIRFGTYTGSFDPHKNKVRQTAGLLHTSQMQRLLDRLIDMEKKLNESIDDLKSLQPNSAAMVRERTEEISRALRNIDKSEVSRLCNRSGAKGEKAKSDIAHQFGRVKAKADDLHNVIINKTDYWSQTSGFKDEDIRQLKRATKLLRGDILPTVLLDERVGGSKAGSARPATLKDLLLADPVTKEEEIHVDAQSNVSSEDYLSASESVANSESARGGNSAIPKWETDVLEALKNFTPATDKWLQDNNYAVATNHGTGMNCLLISLLQHAMRNYDDEHEQLAQQIRAKLEEKHGDIEPGGMLSVFPGNDRIFQDAVAMINYELDAGLDPILVFPTEDGHPNKGRDDDKIEIGSRKNLIVYGRNGSLHFEALRRNDSTIQNRNDGRETNTLALPVDGSAANKKALERKALLARTRAMVHIKGKSEDPSIRNMDRPLKGDNLEMFKERMDECVASVRTAQSWQEKAASVKDIQRHLQGAEGKLAELNPDETQVLAKVLKKLLQDIEGQQKIQSRLSAEEDSRILREQTVSTLGAVAYQLKGVITRVDPLKFLEFSETQFREKISIAAPGKSWAGKRRDILDVKRALNGLGPEIDRLQIAPTSMGETSLANRLTTARKLEVTSLLASLQMQINEEQKQMPRPKRANSEEAQVKALQNEVAKQLERYIARCWPLGLFKSVGRYADNSNFETDLYSFEDTVLECLRPTDEGPGSASKRIRHLNYLQSELAKLGDEHLGDLFDDEKNGNEKIWLGETIDVLLREDVARRYGELENRQVSQSAEEIQAVDEDDVEKELVALNDVEAELKRLSDLCKSPSTPESVAAESEASSESEDDYGMADLPPLGQRLT